MEMKSYRRGVANSFGKKAFAFTFLAFFLSIIIFAYIYLNMGRDDFTKDNVFKESRITYIDDELKYFKNTYIKSAMKYSLYNSLDTLLNYTNTTPGLLDDISSNYTLFNELVGEGMYHGSFEGYPQDYLHGKSDGVNKTLRFFVDQFKDNFEEAYKGDFNFDIKDVNVYEKNPYYVSMQVISVYNVSTKDNISSWHFKDEFDVSVPIYELNDPRFYNEGGFEVPILPSERYLSLQNWTIENFKESMDNGYTQVYLEPNYKYTLGDSYLGRLLGDNRGEYGEVLGFWSFDYDEEMGGVYDSSLYSNLSKHYGNSRVLYSFESDFVNESLGEVYDKSDYNSTGIINGSMDCSVLGIRGNGRGCYFDGATNFIESGNVDVGGEDNASFSFSLWVNTASDVGGALIGKTYDAFAQGGADSNIFLSMNSSGSVGWRLEYNSSNDEDTLYGEKMINDGLWHHVVGIRREGDFEIYVDGFIDKIYKKEDYYIENSNKEYHEALEATSNLHIGIYRPSIAPSSLFEGTIDEIGVYSKALSKKEIAMLYEEQKAKHIDYVDTIHGRGIDMDGFDDYINISQDVLHSGLDEFAIDAWVKPEVVDTSKKKVLVIEERDYPGGENFSVKLEGLGYEVIKDTDIATKAEVDSIDPDVVACFAYAWECTKYDLLNDLYGSGYSIFTEGNDNNDNLYPITSTIGMPSGTFAGPVISLNDHPISRGWDITPGSGDDNRQGITEVMPNSVVLANDTVLDVIEVLYLEEVGAGKWFHYQPHPNISDTLFENALLFLTRDPIFTDEDSDLFFNVSVNTAIENEWSYLALSFKDDILDFYLNSKLISSIEGSNLINDNSNSLFFGKGFKGVVDEVKIYNRTLSEEEVLQNYHNYNSFSKGCCNYLSPINPNALGYNDSAYKENVSYSSKLFYRYLNEGFVPDIILYNVSNLSSQDPQEKYYNLMFDKCLADAYDVFSYENDADDIHVDVVDVDAEEGVNCADLIREGYY